MHELRGALWQGLRPFVIHFPGWTPHNVVPPCGWSYVACDREGHITSM